MQRVLIRKQIRKFCILIVEIILLLTVYEGKVYAMELNQEEIKREETCRLNIKKYEMNFILEILDIREWNAPPYAFDERHLPVDEPLGTYSEKALEKYLEDGTESEVEIEYYFGGYRPSKPEDKHSMQVVKVYKQDKLVRLGYAIWSWWGDTVMEWNHYKMDQISMEENKAQKKHPSFKGKLNVESVKGLKEGYKGDVILSTENLEEVMETFMMIKNDNELYKLAKLPLTESFYNQCVEKFSYVEDSESMNRFWIDFWGIGNDGNLICQCILSPYTKELSRIFDENYTYFIEMQIEEGRIDSMDMKLVRRYLPEDK